MRFTILATIVVLFITLILPVVVQAQNKVFDARAYQEYEEQEQRAYAVFDSIDNALYEEYEREDSEEYEKFFAKEKKLLRELKGRSFKTYVEWLELERSLGDWPRYRDLITTVPELKKIASARNAWSESTRKSRERFERAKLEAWERFEATRSSAWKRYQKD